jgi:hypothetical protein
MGISENQDLKDFNGLLGNIEAFFVLLLFMKRIK